MIFCTDAFVSDLAAIRANLAEVEYAKRGHEPKDCLEGWYPEPGELGGKIDRFAADYAAGTLQAVADEPTALLCTWYEPGMWCPDHVDQFFGREAPDTGHRTVSVSILIEQADDGGEMVFQDRNRIRPPIITNEAPGTAIFFPADWWHAVAPVKVGTRKSLVRWYADASGRQFNSGRA